MAEEDETGSKQGAAASPHDASLRVDPRTLPAGDQDFARMMGFGDDGQTPAPTTTPAALPAAAIAHPEEEPEEPDATGPPEDTVVPDAAEESVEAGVEAEPAETSSAAPPREWDEIHPRPATLGRQSILIERAELVLSLPPTSTGPAEAGGARSPRPAIAASADDSRWLEQLRQRDDRIAVLEASQRSLEEALAAASAVGGTSADPAPSASAAPRDELDKALERLQAELDGLLLERDRLGDALAVANAARAEACARAERLETAYRSARGPEGPVPEGERELRGEVIGLRRRLEESGAESRRLREALDARATDLAIARAQGDDRQQELEQQREQLAALERERANQLERLDESLARQRELLALVSRVQAENVELRSTQAALEETLEARDLEISAREEHLLVTRRGLAARDGQLVDAEERLEQERHRRELVESELERARLAHSDLADTLTRRDARIATLSITLARVEEAIGRTASPASPRADRERTEPSGAPEAAVASAPEGTDTPSGSQEAGTSADAPASACVSTCDGNSARSAGPPSLPPILARWRDARVAAACAPEEIRTAADFHARALADRFARGAADRAAAEAAPTLRVTSLGGARAEAEVELVTAWRALGAGGLEVRVVDRSPASARARRDAIEAAGLAASISVEDWTSAERGFEPGASALLVVDAVGADVKTAEILDRMAPALARDAVVLFADRLAGGPVLLSEATREKLSELWQVLPESWTTRPGFETPPGPGDDGGSPRLEPDPLAALLERFRPTVTIGFGHVVDLFLGSARGFELSQAGGEADGLLAPIDAIDESRSILESLAPRHGVGVLVARTPDTEADEASGVEVIGLAWPEPVR